MRIAMDHRSKGLPDWRGYLTPDEACDLAAMEANSRKLASRRKRLSHEIGTIRARAIMRRKAAIDRKDREELEALRAERADA